MCFVVVCVFFVVGIVLYLPVYSFDEGCGESIVFATVCMVFHSFCFSLGFNGKQCILVR